MSRTGRPRKENSRRNREEFLVSEKESREIREFAALNRVTKSEFIRQAIAKRVEETRNRLGIIVPDDYYHDDFYDDFDEDDEDFDEY